MTKTKEELEEELREGWRRALEGIEMFNNNLRRSLEKCGLA